jgi:hypothetical protein
MWRYRRLRPRQCGAALAQAWLGDEAGAYRARSGQRGPGRLADTFCESSDINKTLVFVKSLT